jgi:hypothetical protein
LALGLLGLLQKVKLLEKDLIIGVLFSFAILSQIHALFLSPGFSEICLRWSELCIFLFGTSYL